MTAITAAGRLLAADAGARTLTYLLLPYGEEGRTNVGRVTASRGCVTLPDDPSSLRLNVEHDATRPVGRGVSLEDTDDGLVASFAIARTRAGDDLLEEAAEGLRPAVSVEIDAPAIRAGRLVAGLLTGAGAVVDPAFPSAQLVAADAGDLPDGYEYLADTNSETTSQEEVVIDGVTYVVKRTTTSTQETTPKDAPSEDETAEDSAGSETDMGDSLTARATAPAGGVAARRSATTKPLGKGDLFRMLASAHSRGGERALMAALSDVVPGDILGIEQPQYVGELWSGKKYERKIIPLFAHADLTSFEVKGWRWVTKPVVAPYSGNKTDVPSNEIETEQVTINAERIAGAHDIDRKFRDFNDEAFFAAYFAAMTESYAKVSDAQVLADVITAAGTPIPVGDVPTGVGTGMTAIVDGALAVLNATDTMPSFGIVATDLWRSIVLTREQDKLAFLNAALGLEEGSITQFRVLPSAAIASGSVLVGARDALTVHELGGAAPIRVEALNVAQGGVDEGVFGYYAVNVHDEDGLAIVSTDA